MIRRPPCSTQSAERRDPIYGTASAGTAWVLLELGGGWGHSAFLQSPSIIDHDLGLRIVRRVEKQRMRIVAIRRPGRRPPTPRWRWFIVNAEPGAESVHTGEVDGPAGYLDLALDGSDGQATTEPLVAVCAHGKHDQCCAVRGRAATAAIASAYPEWTWECSHLGGDRFAATGLILPHGLCYGRLDTATDPATVVELYTQGRLDDSLLRGRTSLSHAVQAAQHFARVETGDDRIESFAPIDVAHLDGRIRVRLVGDGAPIDVVLIEEFSEPLFSMCEATVTGRVRQFDLDSLTIGHGAAI
ncbi:sucrase ferredoxin [Gordonia aichiensis]